MRYYFSLRFRMWNRQWADWGLPPVWAYPLLTVAFLGLSAALFSKTSFAAYIYPFFALAYIARLSEAGRNDFLKNIFPKGEYLRVRILENTGLALPFCGVLLYTGNWLIAAGLSLMAAGIALVNWRGGLNRSLPTPFHRRPFEFAIGFRRAFPLVLFAYFLIYQAARADNFNLGIFALLLIHLTNLSYYFQPEPRYYAWLFALSPKGFLWRKIKTAWWYSALSCLPALLCLGLFFMEKIHFALLLQILGGLYLTVVILAKYAAFPHKINLPQGILLSLGLWLPPLLLGIIPFFYKKSILQLSLILDSRSGNPPTT